MLTTCDRLESSSFSVALSTGLSRRCASLESYLRLSVAFSSAPLSLAVSQDSQRLSSRHSR